MDHTPATQTAAFTRAEVFNTIRAADRMLATDTRADPTTIRALVRCASIVDEGTTDHVHRVAGFARSLAAACGWKGIELEHLTVAATLHDIGKIGVAPALLTKPGQLTPRERAAVERHTTLAESLLRGCTSPLMRMARKVGAHHHEHWNGSGYPHGLAGSRIPIAARFVALADVFDALTSDRPYRPALDCDLALSMIAAGAGTQFDPTLTAAFLRIQGASLSCA